MRAFVFVLVALVADVAVAEGTALFPIDAGATGSAEAKLKRDIPVVVKDVLRTSYRAIADAAVPDGAFKCSQLPSCVQKAAAAADVDEVVFIKATRPGPEQGANAYANLTLTVFNSDGLKVLSFDQTITNTTGIVDLRGLIVKSFTPALYTGRLQLRGVADDDEVLIDGLRLDQRREVALRAGPHKGRVKHKDVDAGVAELSFDVPFEGVVAVEVPPPGVLSSSVGSADLPLYAHGLSTVVALGTAIGLGARELYWRNSASLLERSTCQTVTSDESGAGFENLGTNRLGACIGVQSELHQWVQLNRDLHLTIGIGMTAVAAASTTALLVPLFLTPTATE